MAENKDISCLDDEQGKTMSNPNQEGEDSNRDKSKSAHKVEEDQRNLKIEENVIHKVNVKPYIEAKAMMKPDVEEPNSFATTKDPNFFGQMILTPHQKQIIAMLESESMDSTCVKLEHFNEANEQNLIFRKPLTESDAHGARVTLPEEHIIDRSRFSVLNACEESQLEEIQILQFIDDKNEYWEMNLLCNWTQFDDYRGWKAFMDAHKLKVNDLIQIHKPDHPLNDKHYLIRYKKKQEDGIIFSNELKS